MAKTSVMIVDDQQMARKLFEMYLQSSEQYQLACTLETAAYAADVAAAAPVDLILMDIQMNDGSNGLAAAEKIKQARPEIKIIAITSMAEASWLKRARQIGIESFWYKEASEETILEVMDKTMAGQSVYPDSPLRVQLGLVSSVEFTERELEVLRAMTRGLSNAAIAGRLGISENTVKVHIQHMLDKTGYENRTELAIKARVSGVVVSLE